MRIPSLPLIALMLSCGSLSGCNLHVTHASRSGSVTEDYVEEPLSAEVQKYEHALEVSNAFLDKLKERDFHTIYESMCGDPIRNAADEHGFAAMVEDFEQGSGAMKSYKPQQWGFVVKTGNAGGFLYSTKIVEYEHGMKRFNFIFVNDGKYEKLSGFNIHERHGVAEPGN